MPFGDSQDFTPHIFGDVSARKWVVPPGGSNYCAEYANGSGGHSIVLELVGCGLLCLVNMKQVVW